MSMMLPFKVKPISEIMKSKNYKSNKNKYFYKNWSGNLKNKRYKI